MDRSDSDTPSNRDYHLLLEIERLESLQEEIEEASGDTAPVATHLQLELVGLGLRSVAELRERIALLHAQVVDD